MRSFDPYTVDFVDDEPGEAPAVCDCGEPATNPGDHCSECFSALCEDEVRGDIARDERLS